MKRPILVKLGGSVITFKDRPISANVKAINNISRILGQISPLIVVHGGGSFGHHWSIKYNMHTKPAAYDLRGVAVVHESMIALNQLIVNSMIEAGINPYAFSPAVFTSCHKPLPAKIKEIGAMAEASLIPITYGDVVPMGDRKYSILSGDALMTILAKALRPARVIFATNVDGIYKDMQSKELLSEMRLKSKVEFSSNMGVDVTGGMKRKVGEAFKIASFGMDVMMVNGLVPKRIIEAAEGTLSIGTIVRGRR